MPARRQSAVFVWSDRALFLGDRSETDVHAHNAVEMSIALDEHGVDVDQPGGRALRGSPGVVVRSDAHHRLRIPGPKVAVLYLDRHAAAGRALHTWLGDRDLRPLPAQVARTHLPSVDALFRADRGLADADRVCTELVAALTDVPRPTPVDWRVRKATAYVLARLGNAPSRAEVADHVGLSAGRLGHLFREQMGLPLRRWILWMRLRAALTEALASGRMTDAAHAAGFADAAHFSRTCRRMFGLPPTKFAPVDDVFVSP